MRKIPRSKRLAWTVDEARKEPDFTYFMRTFLVKSSAFSCVSYLRKKFPDLEFWTHYPRATGYWQVWCQVRETA